VHKVQQISTRTTAVQFRTQVVLVYLQCISVAE